MQRKETNCIAYLVENELVEEEYESVSFKSVCTL